MHLFIGLGCNSLLVRWKIRGPLRLRSVVVGVSHLTVPNKQGFNLECLHLEPVERTAGHIPPFVIYLHGNSSAGRVEVLLLYLPFLLSLVGVAVCSIDGSGKSDGEYVSLGYYERGTLSSFVEERQQARGANDFFIWIK